MVAQTGNWETQWHHLRGHHFVGWYSLESTAVFLRKRIDIYTPVTHGCDREFNFALGIPTPVMLSYMADHLRMSGTRVLYHIGRMLKEWMESTTLGAFLHTVHHGLSIGQLRSKCLALTVKMAFLFASNKVGSGIGLSTAFPAFSAKCIIIQSWLFQRSHG